MLSKLRAGSILHSHTGGVGGGARERLTQTQNRQSVVEKDVGSNSRRLFLHSEATNDDLKDIRVEAKPFTTVSLTICELPPVSPSGSRPCQTPLNKNGFQY